jgi:hypothetical protein
MALSRMGPRSIRFSGFVGEKEHVVKLARENCRIQVARMARPRNVTRSMPEFDTSRRPSRSASAPVAVLAGRRGVWANRPDAERWPWVAGSPPARTARRGRASGSFARSTGSCRRNPRTLRSRSALLRRPSRTGRPARSPRAMGSAPRAAPPSSSSRKCRASGRPDTAGCTPPAWLADDDISPEGRRLQRNADSRNRAQKSAIRCRSGTHLVPVWSPTGTFRCVYAGLRPCWERYFATDRRTARL